MVDDRDVLKTIAGSAEGLTTAELAQRLGVAERDMGHACNRLKVTDRIVSTVRDDGLGAWLPALRSLGH